MEDYIKQLEEDNERLRELLTKSQEDKDEIIELVATIAGGMGPPKTALKLNGSNKSTTFFVKIEKNEKTDKYIQSLYDIKKQLYDSEGLKMEFELSHTFWEV